MMEVILREDVQSLGKAGELVRVKPGYARNFLLPKRPRVRGDRGQQEAHRGRGQGARHPGGRREGRGRGARRPSSAALTVTLPGKAGEEGKLFGSITAQDIAAALAAAGLRRWTRKIELEHPDQDPRLPLGRRCGSSPDVHAEVKVNVVPE